MFESGAAAGFCCVVAGVPDVPDCACGSTDRVVFPCYAIAVKLNTHTRAINFFQKLLPIKTTGILLLPDVQRLLA